MNKYINSFNNLLEYSYNFDGIEAPSVTHLKDSGDTLFKDTYHAPTEDKYEAHIGDLVFYNDMIYNDEIEGDKPLYMDPRDPRVPFMFENDPCYGVVVSLPSYNDDDMIRIVSLDFMDYNQATYGNKNPVPMMWGKYGTEVTNLTSKDKILAYTPGTTTLALASLSYFGTDFNLIDSCIRPEDVKLKYCYNAGETSMVPSPYTNSGTKNNTYFNNSSSILNQGLCGSDNTDKIISMSSAAEGDGSFSNEEEVYPAAMCCRSYYYDDVHDADGGTASYYLPSIAELGLLAARIEEINFARQVAGYPMLVNIYLWSSSLFGSSYAWQFTINLGIDFGYCGANNKNDSVGSVLAFLAL